MPKNVHTIAQLQWSHMLAKYAQNSPSQASTVCEPWTSRCSNWIYKKQRNQRSNCQHPLDNQKSKRAPEKHLLLLYCLCQAFDCVDHRKLWKILQEMGISDYLTCLLRNQYTSHLTCLLSVQVKKQQLELDMEKQTGSKLGKEYVKAIFSLSYLTSMQSRSCEMPGWMKHKLESRLPGEISITSYMQMTPPLCQKVKKN